VQHVAARVRLGADDRAHPCLLELDRLGEVPHADRGGARAQGRPRVVRVALVTGRIRRDLDPGRGHEQGDGHSYRSHDSDRQGQPEPEGEQAQEERQPDEGGDEQGAGTGDQLLAEEHPVGRCGVGHAPSLPPRGPGRPSRSSLPGGTDADRRGGRR
jgi:hypothetical protein